MVVATLLAVPVEAGITIPDDPLMTAARVAPNILFILDDSGSMAYDYMPDILARTSGPNVASLAYTRNSLSYNPAVTYAPWMRADGNRMTTGASYTAAFGSFNLASGTTINLGSSSSCGTFNRNNYNTSTGVPYADNYSSGTQVCGGVQTYYVPKDTARTDEAYLGDGTNYYRYQILEGGSDIVRAEYGAVVRTQWAVNIDSRSPYTSALTSSTAVTHRTANVPAGVGLEITIRNTEDRANTRTLAYEVYSPLNVRICNGSLDKGRNYVCSVQNAVAGQYRVVLQRSNNRETRYSVEAVRYVTNSCEGATSGSGWINCVSSLPNTSRTFQEELVNYATWFSFHRTRMKAAKAGASEAFGALDGKVRAGFRTIWNRSSMDIPVGDGNEGRFVDRAGTLVTNSRTNWYSRLHGVIGANGTPLLSALTDAGAYYSRSGASGPYGPQAGNDQYSCRQNFAILTTDGYWNNDSTSVGNVDGTAGTEITGPRGRQYRYSPVGPYQDSHPNTLADVAMYYWGRDLRDDLVNNVPTSDANPAFWQHMVTFGISIGLSGNTGWKSVADVPQNASWPNPTDGPSTGDADRIDDLLHASVNGRGAFVAASNPREFTQGLSTALEAISQRTSSYSNVATNSVSLDAGSQVFSASYVSGVWTGTVTARPVGRRGVSDTVNWTASTPVWSERKIYTSSYTSVGLPGARGATFPTAAQEAALGRDGGPANYQVSGLENSRYLKGSSALEARNGGRLRNRASVIGDIVGSSPAYVKETNTLYVGANDGMLHAFNASDGVELFAYVPNIIDFNALSTLSRGDYAHKFFVDGPVVVSSRRLTPNRNILVGTLGKGGKGLFALNVTDPAAITASNLFMWERNETPGGHMGLVLGKPFFSRLGDDRRVVVLGNGINSRSNRAALIVLDADTGAVVREIDTGVGDEGSPNGLSAPTGVLGPDGKTLAYVYAGDMLGNVWKFDLTSNSSTPVRLFTATRSGVAQPISGGVTVATHPRTGKRWVFFGTGRFLTVEDADANSAASTAVQSMYGFIEGDAGAAVSRSELTRRSVTNAGLVDGIETRVFDERSALPQDSKGWFIDLPERGERIVQDAQVVSTFLVTASMAPTGTACEADGKGFINALDAFTGTSAGGSYFDLDGDGDTSDSTVGGRPIGSIDPGVGMPTLPNLLRGLLIVGGTTGDTNDPFTLAPQWERVSWREIRRD